MNQEDHSYAVQTMHLGYEHDRATATVLYSSRAAYKELQLFITAKHVLKISLSLMISDVDPVFNAPEYAAFTHHISSTYHNTYYSGNILYMHAHVHLVL